MEQESFPVWKGLFDWSMKFQDGTMPTGTINPEDFTPERRAWLTDALKFYMQDFADRMKQIKEALEAPEAEANDAEADLQGKLEERETLLEELMDIVSSIDQARDLHKIGGLAPLLGLLRCRHPSLRWRAAEVIATCCANNPPVQLWFDEGGVLAPLMELTSDEDVTCRTKALLALSAFVRHSAPGLAACRAAGGLERLVALCSDADYRVQRKALSLLQYVLVRDGPTAAPLACSLGAITPMAQLLGAKQPSSAPLPAIEGEEEGDVGTELRQAALSALLELAHATPATWDAVKRTSSLPEAVRRLRDRHAALPTDEDREAEREEGELASELLALLELPVAPEEIARSSESDHVALDMTEPNLRGPSTKAAPSPAAVGGGSAAVAAGAGSVGIGGPEVATGAAVPDWRLGGGAMVACPKVDKI